MYLIQFCLSALIFLSTSTFIFAQSILVNGQLWASGKSTEDQNILESRFGYIPTFSVYYKLNNSRMIDLEWAYRLDRSYSSGTLNIKNERIHRYWLRYSSENLEARLGLQKIVFGPSQVLRVLSWFDTIDPEDPTNQTDGVEALRLRWFPSNSISIWSWAINSDEDILLLGGRAEFSTHRGEWGLAYHQNPSKSLQMIVQTGIPVMGSHNRLAFDFRFDGFIGFWNENAIIQSDNIDINMAVIGGDYTLPALNGMLFMTETLLVSGKQNNSTYDRILTAFMANMPMGMFHNLMLISTLDWDENNSYNYLRFSSTFDSFSINCMASINPNEFDNSLQLMFIYNH